MLTLSILGSSCFLALLLILASAHARAVCCAAAAGPLNAVVQAQAQAAQSTVNFIRQAGFNDRNETINARFSYSSTNATTGEKKDMVLSVPVLTLLPIPYLRVSSTHMPHLDTALAHLVTVLTHECVVSTCEGAPLV